jgi:hypothetical protein
VYNFENKVLKEQNSKTRVGGEEEGEGEEGDM